MSDHQRHEECAENTQHRTDRAADQPFQADLLQAPLEEDDCAAEGESTQGGRYAIHLKRSQEVGASTQNKYEDDANDNEISQNDTSSGASSGLETRSDDSIKSLKNACYLFGL